LAGVNRNLVAAVRLHQPNLVWIDKGLTIRSTTLGKIRSECPTALLVNYSPDDMSNPQHLQKRYWAGLARYDLVVTTKSYSVPELTALGARAVMAVDNAFCPSVHRPVTLTDRERQELGGPVGFIGFPEREREKSVQFLASHGVQVRVWGPWRRQQTPHLIIEGRPLWENDYARAIAAFDINLCFLRKVNRDRQTTRSIEIPACGGFLLAERTDEHLRLFAEGKEAEFFGSDQELLAKTRYYLDHPQERARIAAEGRNRCLRDGYSNAHRLAQVLERVASIQRRENSPPRQSAP
jgi:hypothetical protein